MKRHVTYIINDEDYTDKKEILVDADTCRYIIYLERKIRDIRHEKHGLKAELRAIKPVVETGNLTPAVSRECGNCKYVVRSSWSNDIIGCRKSCTCEDFTPEEK